MGLDGVELILAVEDAFQIHIANEEAGRVSTVGDLRDPLPRNLRNNAEGLDLCLERLD
jgi:acyl carrier protein